MSRVGEIVLEGEPARRVLLEVFDHLSDRRIRTAAAFRNALITGDGCIAVNPMLETKMLTNDMIHTIINGISFTVKQGHMIDFGYIPNAVIKAESVRARAPFEAGELLHPYDDHWLGVTSWEGGYNGYFVMPRENNVSSKNPILVAELYGVKLEEGYDLILLYDIVAIHPQPGRTTLRPLPMVIPPGFDGAQLHIDHDSKRAANSLDPLVTMLRFLADASVSIERVDAPTKLNAARIKRGKSAIPPHTFVRTTDYVTALTSHSGAHGVDRGGTHASPIAHWRRAHDRHLSGERVVKVRSSKVNWRSNEELHRLFYRVER